MSKARDIINEALADYAARLEEAYAAYATAMAHYKALEKEIQDAGFSVKSDVQPVPYGVMRPRSVVHIEALEQTVNVE